MEGEKMVSGSGICSKRVVVDARLHRLASIIAKELLSDKETKRKERSQAVYERIKLRAKAQKVAEEKLGSQLDVLASIKY